MKIINKQAMQAKNAVKFLNNLTFYVALFSIIATNLLFGVCFAADLQNVPDLTGGIIPEVPAPVVNAQEIKVIDKINEINQQKQVEEGNLEKHAVQLLKEKKEEKLTKNHDYPYEREPIKKEKIIKKKTPKEKNVKVIQTNNKNFMKIPFHDNEQIPLKLSTTNVNRLFVTDDKITKINAPSGFFVAKNDPSGSVFLNIDQSHPFTMYITTDHGHQLSIQVQPQNTVGKTYELNPITQKINKKLEQAAEWEKESDYKKLLVRLMKAMISSDVPEGYGYTSVDAKSAKKSTINFNDIAELVPVEIYSGSKLVGTVYKIHNKTRRALTVMPSDFYKHGVRAVALSQQKLLPHSTGLLFVINSSNNRVNEE